MEDILKCPHCGQKMMVYETREHVVSGFVTLLRRRKCLRHTGHRVATMELPQDVAKDVLLDD